jgi:hypothetical protein
MEIVNAGDVPLGSIIHRLFSEKGLEQLVGQRGTACFVLARSALIPDFYQKLIQNIDTIDGTTRDYIAFIVFYGRLVHNLPVILHAVPSGPQLG